MTNTSGRGITGRDWPQNCTIRTLGRYEIWRKHRSAFKFAIVLVRNDFMVVILKLMWVDEF